MTFHTNTKKIISFSPPIPGYQYRQAARSLRQPQPQPIHYNPPSRWQGFRRVPQRFIPQQRGPQYFHQVWVSPLYYPTQRAYFQQQFHAPTQQPPQQVPHFHPPQPAIQVSEAPASLPPKNQIFGRTIPHKQVVMRTHGQKG